MNTTFKDRQEATVTPTEAFRKFVKSDEFPCIGAKSAMVRDQLMIAEFGEIDSAAGDIKLRLALDFVEPALIVKTSMLLSCLFMFAA